MGFKGKGFYMARQQQNNNQPVRTVQDKCDYYGRRVNDPNLTQGQRNFALRRLNSLCGGGKQQPKQSPARKSTLPATAQQNNAKMAGIGFGAAKAGGRVPISPENKQSFRAGIEEGRALAKKY